MRHCLYRAAIYKEEMESPKSTKPKKWKVSRWFIYTTLLIIAVILAVMAFPVLSHVSINAPTTRNLAHAKQIGLACLLYAGDHDNKLPQSLSELVPDYISTADALQKLRYRDPDTGIYHDWILFLDSLNVAGETILLAAPIPYKFKDRGYQRVVIYADQSGMASPELKFFQQLGRQMRATSHALPTPAPTPISRR